jgi:hypothetical protein
VVEFTEVVNRDEEDVDPRELWNWIENICIDWPPDSSEGLYINKMEINHKEDSDKLNLIQEHHDSPSAGHPGSAYTLELIQRNHQWKGKRMAVDRHVRNCHVCQCSKSRNQKIQGWLKPQEVTQQPWKDLSMDFMLVLLESDGYNAQWVVIDKLSKMKHMVQC